jgi:flagellin
LHAGIGNLVDADMAEKSASLQPYRVKESHGEIALSVANAAPPQMLALFRA